LTQIVINLKHTYFKFIKYLTLLL